jgi:hypothetical protein
MNRRTKSGFVLTALVLIAAPAASDNPKAMDGSTVVTCGVSTMLFGGAVPPNGFLVNSYPLFINDNGPAGPTTGIYLPGIGSPGSAVTFATPPGYKPMGPVSVFLLCVPTPDGGPFSAYVAARGW